MPYTHVSTQVGHVTGLKDIAHQSIVFAKMQLIELARHHSCSILAPMLQNCQRIIQGLVHMAPGDDSDYSAHLGLFIPNDKKPCISSKTAGSIAYQPRLSK